MSAAEIAPRTPRSVEPPATGAQEHEPPATYYGRPVLKAPVWTDEVGLYFFTGGLAGASGALALAARLAGRPRLARSARIAGLIGAGASAPLLIADLGRPSRFLHMLRVLKPTSPMSLGTWVLTSFGGASTVANLCALTGRLPGLGLAADALAGALGLPLTTYTAVLVSNTAVPAWHEARRILPFVFAAGAATSAASVAAVLTPPDEAAPARRLAVASAVAELVTFRLMERQLGPLAEPYEAGRAAPLARLARGCMAAGAGIMAAGRGRRAATFVGAAALLVGTVAKRLAILHAGSDSANSTVGLNTVRAPLPPL
jgi:hypothetical protein